MYALDNDDRAAVDHLDGIAALFDRFTTDRLARLLDPAGKVCLELGAGSGSVAVWLAERVGGHGRVVATDIKPGRIPARPRLAVLEHDLTRQPPPVRPADLIHARLVLGHLPQRAEILRSLVDTLGPGGVLVIEDFHALSGVSTVLDAPDEELAVLYTTYMRMRSEIFAGSGTDRSWALRLHRSFRALGLTDVDTVVYARSFAGGSPGAGHARGTFRQFRSRLLARGMTEEQLRRIDEGLADPRFVVASHPLYSTAGRRAAG